MFRLPVVLLYHCPCDVFIAMMCVCLTSIMITPTYLLTYLWMFRLRAVIYWLDLSCKVAKSLSPLSFRVDPSLHVRDFSCQQPGWLFSHLVRHARRNKWNCQQVAIDENHETYECESQYRLIVYCAYCITQRLMSARSATAKKWLYF